jgi:type IV pilus assembly protein PilM
MLFGSSSIVGIDLGNRAIKAVRLDKKNNAYVLTRVAYLQTATDAANPPTEDTVAAQLKEVGGLVRAKGCSVYFSINSLNATVRYVELPQINLEDLRTALKLNSSTYLRQNFENYIFDACPLDAEGETALMMKKKGKKIALSASGKVKVLVGGISSTETVLYFHGARKAGMRPLGLQLAPISVMNCFNAAYTDMYRHQPIALLDIGFLSSSLTILEKGKPLLTRPVPVGGKHISDYIAQMSGTDFAKAEASKTEGGQILADAVSRTCVTLIREVRSSINFFEKNSDQAIPKVHITGGSVISPTVVEALSKDIGTACEVWDPANGLHVELPHEQHGIFAQNQPAFSTALGVARSNLPKGKEIPVAAAPVAAAPEPAK